MVDLPPAGVSVALLTPVTEAGALDLEAVDHLVARAVAGGVAGLSPVGSTGEGWRLSRQQRRDVTARVAARAEGRPVIAGVPFLAADEVLADIEEAAVAGADSALLAPPGYYPISDEEISGLFAGLADRSPLPLLLYHIPSLARVGFPAQVVAELATHPNVIGLKDSGRDLEYLREVARATADCDFGIVTGADTLLPESLELGAIGTIAASPNVDASLTKALYDACMSDDATAVAKTRDRLLDLVAACRSVAFPKGWKAAASLAGGCGPTPVPPGRPIDPAELDQLRAAVADIM